MSTAHRWYIDMKAGKTPTYMKKILKMFLKEIMPYRHWHRRIWCRPSFGEGTVFLRDSRFVSRWRHRVTTTKREDFVGSSGSSRKALLHCRWGLPSISLARNSVNSNFHRIKVFCFGNRAKLCCVWIHTIISCITSSSFYFIFYCNKASEGLSTSTY